MRSRFDRWVEKIPWRREWQPTPVFLPGESMDRRAWWAIVHRVSKSWHDWVNNTHFDKFSKFRALLQTCANLASACDVMLRQVGSTNLRPSPPPLLLQGRRRKLPLGNAQAGIRGKFPVGAGCSHPSPAMDRSQALAFCNMMLACISPGFWAHSSGSSCQGSWWPSSRVLPCLLAAPHLQGPGEPLHGAEMGQV